MSCIRLENSTDRVRQWQRLHPLSGDISCLKVLNSRITEPGIANDQDGRRVCGKGPCRLGMRKAITLDDRWIGLITLIVTPNGCCRFLRLAFANGYTLKCLACQTTARLPSKSLDYGDFMWAYVYDLKEAKAPGFRADEQRFHRRHIISAFEPWLDTLSLLIYLVQPS